MATGLYGSARTPRRLPTGCQQSPSPWSAGSTHWPGPYAGLWCSRLSRQWVAGGGSLYSKSSAAPPRWPLRIAATNACSLTGKQHTPLARVLEAQALGTRQELKLLGYVSHWSELRRVT